MLVTTTSRLRDFAGWIICEFPSADELSRAWRARTAAITEKTPFGHISFARLDFRWTTE
jgi:hypothetical protein